MLKEDHVSELIPAYALGALDRNEAREVEAHLPGCPDCRAELRQMEMIAHDLPLGILEEAPPADLRRQLQERIAPKTAAVPVRAKPSAWQEIMAVFRRHKALTFSAAALVGLLFVLLASTIVLWQQVNDLQSGPQPGTLQAVPLSSTGTLPQAQGYITISWDGLSGAIVLDRVPQLPEEQLYTLWLVRDGQRVMAAQLGVDELGYGGGRVNPPRPLFDYEAAEVTIEAAEGSEQPTSPVILGAPLFPPNN